MCDPLLLIPTSFERDRLIAALKEQPEVSPANSGNHPLHWRTELCGFGIAAAGVMAMRWLHLHQPRHVILAGIAGALSEDCEIGSAIWFDHVVCDGVGVGENARFVSATELGWNAIETSDQFPSVRGRLKLVSQKLPTEQAVDCLVTACAASSDSPMASVRQQRVTREEPTRPIRFAEDMEGFSVAIACHVMRVPLSIVRGISNHAGDRDHSRWQIDDAIRAVAIRLCMFESGH